MLSELYIENIAVIEKLSVSLGDGFNVFTGETGAGKSIIIDAINAVLGRRTSKELIRSGEEKAVVSAVFSDISADNREIISALGFAPDEDGLLILHRELFANGKNICKVNGVPVNVGTLRELSRVLITIHGQHESYELLTPDQHTHYLNYAGHLENDLKKYKEAYGKYKESEKKLKENTANESERLRRADMLRYQIDELKEADLKEGEDERLSERRRVLLSSEKIKACLSSAQNLLNGDDENMGIVSSLKESCEALSEAAEYQSELSELSQRLMNAYYEIEDISQELSGSDDFSDNTEQELEMIEERLDLIYRLQRKYGNSIGEMQNLLDKSEKELEYLESYEFNMENLSKEYERYKEEAWTLAKLLSEKRKKTAKILTDEIKKQLVFLDMPNVDMIFDIESTQLSDLGCDKVEMLISANPGEAMKPVSKIASGGELSRIMLAIKNVLSESDSTQTLIFDEIDTGISGSASQKVGLKLKEIADNRQVICITHQTQIACLANRHYLIKKEVINGRSCTKVSKLDFNERAYELARIMGGNDISELSLKHAEEMLRAKEPLNISR